MHDHRPIEHRTIVAHGSLVAALALLSCTRPGPRTEDVRGPGESAPSVASATEASAATASAPVAGPSGRVPADDGLAGRDFGDGWIAWWEPPRGPRLEAVAALDAERVVALGGGTLYRAAEGRWIEVDLDGAEALDVAAVDGVLWVRIRDAIVDVPRRQTLRSTDGTTFSPAELPGGWPSAAPPATPPAGCTEPPEGFVPVVRGLGGDGRLAALGVGGAGAVCPIERHELVERWFENGTRGWFEEPLSTGWVPARGGRLPREPLAVLPTDPPLVAGREGQLAALRCRPNSCVVEVLVDEPHPRAIELLPLADGALLVLLDDRLVRLADGHGAPVELDAEGRQWLVEAARPDVWGPHTPQAAALGGATAVLTMVGQARALWIDGAAGRGLTLDAEPLGAAKAGEGEAVLLLNGGRVLRGSPGAWRELGHLGELPPQGVSHAFGVFAGRDGVVRLLDPRRPIACARDTTLEPCGEVVDVDEREVFQLPDGLVVETQHITTTLVSADGIRDRDELPVWKIHDYAGSLGRLWALTETRAAGDRRAPPEYRVRRLDRETWVDLAAVPAECVPQALAADADAVFLACEGGAVLRRAAGR
ncbi:MAG: hypothetical protein JXB32_16385 [Deltaproteobacteria bacterium]|nr:hypothetical protein [Deltaproteobacteria bacterium]